MSLNGTTVAGLKAKTLPLRWWKLVMTLKALTAPVIGAIAWWIVMELTPTAQVDLSNRVDQITIIGVCVFNAVFAGLTALTWHMRHESRVLLTLSILLGTVVGAMASGVIYTLVNAYWYVY